MIKHLSRRNLKPWKDGSEVKALAVLPVDSGFIFSSHMTGTVLCNSNPENSVPSVALCRHQTCILCIDIYVGKAIVYQRAGIFSDFTEFKTARRDSQWEE